MIETEFWVIWNPLAGQPMVRHYERDAAEREATRLARQCRGTRFYVLHAIEYMCVDDVQRVTLTSAEDDTEVPF